LVTGSLTRATGLFFNLGEVLLEPISNLIHWRFFSGRGLRAFALLGAGRKFRKGVF
jgi:hypothetical protein